MERANHRHAPLGGIQGIDWLWLGLALFSEDTHVAPGLLAIRVTHQFSVARHFMLLLRLQEPRGEDDGGREEFLHKGENGEIQIAG